MKGNFWKNPVARTGSMGVKTIPATKHKMSIVPVREKKVRILP